MTDVLAPGPPVPPVTPACVRLSRWWGTVGTAGWHEQVRRCDEVLRDLLVPAPFTVVGFLAELERVRGRRVVVRVLRTRLGEARALWCRGATTDHILVGSPSPPLHRDHLALHGVGHLVFGHLGRPAVAEGLAGADVTLPDGRPRRVVCTPEEEWQAEVFATRVQQLAAVGPTGPAAGSALPARLAATVEEWPRGQRSTGETHAA